MRILITGGAGFIGSHSADAALAAGHTVRVLDNLSNGQSANLAAGVELWVGDVADPGWARRAVEGCDALLHLAALVSVPHSLAEPQQTYAVNTTGTVTMLEAARAAGVRRFVLASTCAVYGDLPGPHDEMSPVKPLVPYAASKLMAEQWVQLYAHAYGMETVVLRYFNVYGPRQRPDSPYSGVVSRWCAAASRNETCTIFGDGCQTRDFVAVQDVAQANLLVATQKLPAWGQIYQVGTGASVALNDVLAALDSVAAHPLRRFYAPPRAGEIRHSAGSNARLQELGWRPTLPLRDALAALLASQP